MIGHPWKLVFSSWKKHLAISFSIGHWSFSWPTTDLTSVVRLWKTFEILNQFFDDWLSSDQPSNCCCHRTSFAQMPPDARRNFCSPLFIVVGHSKSGLSLRPFRQSNQLLQLVAMCSCVLVSRIGVRSSQVMLLQPARQPRGGKKGRLCLFLL